MLITLEELQEHPVKFDERFPPGHIDYATEGLRQSSDLRVQGKANLLGDEIEIRGDMATTMEVGCARCLELFHHPVALKYDLVYRPISSITRGDEFQVPRGEEELGFYRPSGLLLEDVAKEQVLLAMPMVSVCQTECKGLCPVCGRNLNRETCDCERPADPRWQGLSKIEPE